MPLYEFRCPSGHDFEKFYRSIGTAPSEEFCPECGQIAARLMSAAGLVFKGSGFYITDYGKDGKKDLRDAATQAKAAETKASEAKTEAKADVKPDAGGGKNEPASPKAVESPAPKASSGKTPPTPPSAAPAGKSE